MEGSYLELDFNVTQSAGGLTRYAHGEYRRLVSLGPSVFFVRHRLTNSSRKKLEDIDNAHVNCVSYKLISTSRASDDLSIGFQRNFEAREREWTNNKLTKGN